MHKCWRCTGMGVLNPAIIVQIKKTLALAYEAIPADGNEMILNRINDMRNVLTVTIFESLDEEDFGG